MSLECHPVTVCKKDEIMIATYNVRALFQCGLLKNLKQEIQRLSINIIRIWETRWENNSPFRSDGHRGEKNERNQNFYRTLKK